MPVNLLRCIEARAATGHKSVETSTCGTRLGEVARRPLGQQYYEVTMGGFGRLLGKGGDRHFKDGGDLVGGDEGGESHRLRALLAEDAAGGHGEMHRRGRGGEGRRGMWR